MSADRNHPHLHDLSTAIEESMQPDRPAQWQPAFAAADDKGSKQSLLEQLKQKFGMDSTAVADAGTAQPGAGPTGQVASSDQSIGFANLVRGWLGRA
jgi:hypothetical protein